MARIGKVQVDIRSVPEALWQIRREMAKVLRQHADVDVSPLVAQRLRAIANEFEAGLGGPRQ